MGLRRKWRLIVLKDLDPIRVQTVWHAVALSTSKNDDKNTILLTTTHKPSLSCGYHHNFYDEVDLDYCKEKNIALVRRLAGGGLVLLDKNQVFYNVVFAGYGFPTPLRKLYSYALEGPNLFLKHLNLKSEINFNEIVIGNRKISGTGASSIEHSGVVIGNIILDFDYDKFCNSLNVPNEQFRDLLKIEIRNNLTCLGKEMRSPPSTDETIEGLKNAFEIALKSKLMEDELSENESKTINELEVEYNQKEWNFRKNHKEGLKRSFIKIKKGICIVHEPSLESNFLIINGYIKKIQDFGNNNVEILNGENIFKIKEKFPRFEKLQIKLIKYYELSNV